MVAPGPKRGRSRTQDSRILESGGQRQGSCPRLQSLYVVGPRVFTKEPGSPGAIHQPRPLLLLCLGCHWGCPRLLPILQTFALHHNSALTIPPPSSHLQLCPVLPDLDVGRTAQHRQATAISPFRRPHGVRTEDFRAKRVTWSVVPVLHPPLGNTPSVAVDNWVHEGLYSLFSLAILK